MARSLYASTPGDYVIDVATGNPRPSVPVEVWDSRTSGTQVTDLLNILGETVTEVLSNDQGLVQFYGPDNETDPLWLDTGTGSRMLVRPTLKFAAAADVAAIQDDIDSLQTAGGTYLPKAVFTQLGSLAVGTGAGTYTELTKGSSGKYLKAGASTISWEDIDFNSELNVSITAGVDTPVGTIVAYAGSTAPDGWAICNGASLLRVSYPDLFAVIGTTFGSADGTHFNIPDLRDRTIVGYYSSSTIGASSIGVKFGSGTRALEPANMVEHTHSMSHQHPAGTTDVQGLHYHYVEADINAPNLSGGTENVARTKTGGTAVGTAAGAHAHWYTTPVFTGNTGGMGGTSLPFGIVQPSMALNYIMRVTKSTLSGLNRSYSYWPVWVADVSDGLTATTNLTTQNGTWTVVSGQVNCVGAGASTLCTARHNTPFSASFAGYAVEVDFEVQASLDGASEYVGVAVNTSAGFAAGTGGVSLRVSGDDKVTFWAGTTQETTAKAITALSNGWHTMRLEISSAMATAFVDGVAVYRTNEENIIAEFEELNIYAGVLVYGTQTVRFRDLNGWSLSSGIS